MTHSDASPTNSGPSRLIILDQLRGLCLAVISIDHLILFPSLLEVMTGRGLLWVSAAEGFFFISGLLVGLVRGRQAGRKGLTYARHKLWTRAAQLYAATVLLTITYTVLATLLDAKGIAGSKGGLIEFGDPVSLLINSASLMYSYGWNDFLAYYVVYLLLAPVAIWLLLGGRWRWVLGLSVAAWVAPWLVHLPFPQGLRWQAYFFTGLTAGFYYDDLRRWWHNRPKRQRQKLAKASVITAVGGLAISFTITILPLWFSGYHNLPLDVLRAIEGTPVYRLLFEANRTGLLRLPFFFAVFGAGYMLFQHYQIWIMRHLNWLLEPLGANSLYVYIWQGAFAFAIPFLMLPKNVLMNSIVPIAVILALWALVKRRVLFGIIPR